MKRKNKTKKQNSTRGRAGLFLLLAVAVIGFAGTRLMAETDPTPVVEAVATAAPAISQPDQLPDYFVTIGNFLISLPVAGPALVWVLEHVALIAGLMTALAAFVAAVSKAVVGFARLSGFIAFAQKFQAFHDKVWPIVAYLSMFNVQRTKPNDSPVPVKKKANG